MSIKSIADGAGYVNTYLLQKTEESHELYLRLGHLLCHCGSDVPAAGPCLGLVNGTAGFIIDSMCTVKGCFIVPPCKGFFIGYIVIGVRIFAAGEAGSIGH